MFLLLSANAYTETKKELGAIDDYRESDYRIDAKYWAGEYFIYDCERKHYACVTQESNNNCIEERNIAIGKKTNFYPCAPLSKFADKKSCVEASYKTVDRNLFKRFCWW